MTARATIPHKTAELTTQCGKTIRAPLQLLGSAYVRQPMTGHREYIEPTPFTRPSLKDARNV